MSLSPCNITQSPPPPLPCPGYLTAYSIRWAKPFLCAFAFTLCGYPSLGSQPALWAAARQDGAPMPDSRPLQITTFKINWALLPLVSSTRDSLHPPEQHLVSFLRDQQPWDQLLKSPQEKRGHWEQSAANLRKQNTPCSQIAPQRTWHRGGKTLCSNHTPKKWSLSTTERGRVSWTFT